MKILKNENFFCDWPFLKAAIYGPSLREEKLVTSWKSAIIEGAVVVLCPVEVLSRRQTQHQHKHMAHPARVARQHGPPEPAANSLSLGLQSPLTDHRSASLQSDTREFDPCIQFSARPS